MIVYKSEPMSAANTHPSGWLDRKGQFWNVPNHGHDEFAYWWLQKNGEEPGYMPSNDLEEMGWVHIRDGNFIITKDMNSAQKDAIYDWMHAKSPKAEFSEQTTMTSPKLLTIPQFLETYANEEEAEWKTYLGSDRYTIGNQIYDMYAKSYAAIGTHIKNAEGLFKYPIWEVAIFNGKPIAFMLKEKTKHGIKGGLAGSDGSPLGKKTLIKEHHEGMKRPFHYGELSGRLKELAEKFGEKPIPTDQAIKILKNLGHDPEKVDEQTYKRYLRNVGPVEKSMYGKPSEKEFPKEYMAISKRKLKR